LKSFHVRIEIRIEEFRFSFIRWIEMKIEIC
jgi:hypothetical protein